MAYDDLTPEDKAFLVKVGQISDAPVAPKATPTAAPAAADKE